MESDRSHMPPFWRSPAGIALCVALVAMGFYLLTKHTAHLLGFLPYAFLLACPLIHLFMHHGHGDHQHHPPRSDDDERRQ